MYQQEDDTEAAKETSELDEQSQLAGNNKDVSNDILQQVEKLLQRHSNGLLYILMEANIISYLTVITIVKCLCGMISVHK